MGTKEQDGTERWKKRKRRYTRVVTCKGLIRCHSKAYKTQCRVLEIVCCRLAFCKVGQLRNVWEVPSY